MLGTIQHVRDASWAERGATILVYLSLGTAVGTWAAAIPALKAQLALDAAQLSLVLLTISIASVLATIVAGMLIGRIGSGRATAVAAVLTVVGVASAGLAGSFTQLLACAVLFGGAVGSLEVAVNGHASDIERRWGATIMSSFHAAFSVGGLTGASLGGVVAWTDGSLQAQLWRPLILSIALAGAAVPSLGQGARGESSHRPRLGLPGRRLIVLGIVASLCYLLEGAMADWSALYLVTEAGASAAMAAAGYAAFSITMAAARLGGDAVVARLGATPVMAAGALIAAIGLGMAVLVPSPWPVAFGFALVGFGAANVVPLVFSAAARTATDPAAGIAVVSSFGFAGFMGGPPLIGAIATWAGLRISFTVLFAVALLIAVVALRGEHSDQRSRRRSRT